MRSKLLFKTRPKALISKPDPAAMKRAQMAQSKGFFNSPAAKRVATGGAETA